MKDLTTVSRLALSVALTHDKANFVGLFLVCNIETSTIEECKPDPITRWQFGFFKTEEKCKNTGEDRKPDYDKVIHSLPGKIFIDCVPYNVRFSPTKRSP